MCSVRTLIPLAVAQHQLNDGTWLGYHLVTALPQLHSRPAELAELLSQAGCGEHCVGVAEQLQQALPAGLLQQVLGIRQVWWQVAQDGVDGGCIQPLRLDCACEACLAGAQAGRGLQALRHPPHLPGVRTEIRGGRTERGARSGGLMGKAFMQDNG